MKSDKGRMGWGCYKHEMDASSIRWNDYLNALCNRKLEEKEKTFGRDGMICPRCYIDLEVENMRYKTALEKIVNYSGDADVTYGVFCNLTAMKALSKSGGDENGM